MAASHRGGFSDPFFEDFLQQREFVKALSRFDEPELSRLGFFSITMA